MDIRGAFAGPLASGAVITFGGDTGLSRDSAGVVDVGNGTPGDASGQINAAAIGTKTGASLSIKVNGALKADYGITNASNWSFSNDVYVNNVHVSGGSAVYWVGSGRIISPADGVLRIEKSTGGQLTVSGLPSASTAGAGARSFVTDASSTTFNAIVGGSGSNGVPVFSDGANWRIG